MKRASQKLPDSVAFAAYLRALPKFIKAGAAGRVAQIEGGQIEGDSDIPGEGLQGGHN